MEKRLTFFGLDRMDRPVYSTEDGVLFVDIDPRATRPMALCTKLDNAFDGEPDTPIAHTRYRGDVLTVDRRVIWNF